MRERPPRWLFASPAAGLGELVFPGAYWHREPDLRPCEPEERGGGVRDVHRAGTDRSRRVWCREPDHGLRLHRGARTKIAAPRRPDEGPARQGPSSLARAPVTGCTQRDRGPQADAEERTRSAHRAIEIREKRRGSSRRVRQLGCLVTRWPELGTDLGLSNDVVPVRQRAGCRAGPGARPCRTGIAVGEDLKA